MNMNLIQNLIIGFVSGLTELLPVSAEAHRTLLRLFFGIEEEDAVFRMLVHIGCLVALMWGNRIPLNHLKRARHLAKIPPRRRKVQPDAPTLYTTKLLTTATLFMILLKVFTLNTQLIGQRLNLLALPLIANGILLLLPSLVRSGNKDSRNMPRLDGILMGIGAGLSVIPGISAVGASVSLGISRGVSRPYALHFAQLLFIRVLGIELVFDLISGILGGAAAFTPLGFFYGILGAIMAGLGTTAAMKIMNFMARGNGFVSFSYYSWCFSLFSFILFLSV